MKALRLQLFQETACYKKPAAFKVGETYPLPPYSTVKGMLHALLEATSLIPMKISIQGSYETRITDYQTHYFVKKLETGEIPLVLDGLAQQIKYEHTTTMPIYMHMLLNVGLIIHVQAEDSVLESIQESIKRGVPISLGRWEDLVRIDECRVVELSSIQKKRMRLNHSIYVPDSINQDYNLTGVPYRLNWIYTVRQGIRQWERIQAKYVAAGPYVQGEYWWTDGEDCVAFPLEMGD
ncbi:type I-B CRISPR-associated protein Cas5b [Paenibacillus sp. 481]|uniref:type I-B CRISPR-associated protein Cas5b n=1 Tax=Paenibacillus sp. 481 TaxID=2835869 RepID=UPI001E4ABD4B|nr:type I-B CRISPR-associated protein Cas5b [Paenibacillus sp. 481]UHA72661.1 type I-B CRISPR-associated protein Cas5 [Paenibacillus sp. 481]